MWEPINHDRRRFVGAAAMTIAGARLGVLGSALEQLACAAGKLPGEGELSSLRGANGWLNSEPLTAEALKGKVVLVDFGTYTCINWLRTLPYVQAWARKYKDHGLVVIGVQTPELEFEKNLDSVRRAVKAMRIDYPIAIDNDYAIWHGFDNNYWPAAYYVDGEGRVRHHQFGEGDYDGQEREIQRLLGAAGFTGFDRELVSLDPRGVEAPADWSNLKSPETYVGYARAENFASPGDAIQDQKRLYSAPATLRLNEWALVGSWTIGRQATTLNEANGRIVNRFHARDLNLVMGPPVGGAPVRFRVLIDGQPPGAAHGLDVDAQGNGTATEQRCYQLIRQSKPIDDRKFEIEFLDPGIETYIFTFG
ncbi:MAG TPA: redoxin domain-containing protein [Gemmatimonadaceae bacterium]|nr:redoxin domain-containing protein [Gemmatimonadaceae bacterium]